MISNEFGCERDYIESIYRPIQRDILVAEYCSDNFGYINLVDLYYRKIDANAILIFLGICVVFPVLFMNIAAIADKYLATGMQDLARRFQMSATIAAVTLIAFANGAPDVLSSFANSGKSHGAFIALGSLFGAFIFSATLVVSNVIFAAKGPIKIPKFAILKELSFYLLSIVTVVIFGFLRVAGFPFVGAYLALYALYIAGTLVADRWDREAGKTEEQLRELQALADADENKRRQLVGQEQVLETKDAAEEEEGEEQTTEEEKQGFFDLVLKETVDLEAGILANLVLVPMYIMGLLTIPYLSNPLLKFPLLLLPVSLGMAFFAFVLVVAPHVGWVALIVGAAAGLAVLVLHLLKASQNVLAIVHEILSVLVAVAWMKVFSTLIIDAIAFLAFYFSINEVILSSLLLSAGNTIGDFFGNAALVKSGEEVMGAFACYSGQTFNNFIGFSINMVVQSIAALKEKLPVKFDIFAIDYYTENNGDDVPPPFGQYFLISVIACALLVIVVNFLYFPLAKYTLRKKFAYLSISIYGMFFLTSVIFGVVSGN